jgi:hypothetical protein
VEDEEALCGDKGEINILRTVKEGRLAGLVTC